MPAQAESSAIQHLGRLRDSRSKPRRNPTQNPRKNLSKVLGDAGEAMAAHFLRHEGYRILRRNYRCPHGEIDIIATQGEYLVFVEVKTLRYSKKAGHPALAVSWRKQQRLRQTGLHFMHHHDQLPAQPRFDVIAIIKSPVHSQLEHIPNAF